MIYLFIFVLSSGKEIFTSSTKRSTWNFFFDASWIQKRMDGSSSRTGWYRRPLIIIQSLGYIGRDCYRFSSTAQEKYSHTPCLLFSSLRNFSPSFLFFLPFPKSARSEIGISIVEKSGWRGQNGRARTTVAFHARLSPRSLWVAFSHAINFPNLRMTKVGRKQRAKWANERREISKGYRLLIRSEWNWSSKWAGVSFKMDKVDTRRHDLSFNGTLDRLNRHL